MARFLSWACSEDGEGRGSWQALASVRAPDLPAARAELEALLQAARASAPGPQGPEEDGGTWDADWHEQMDAAGWCELSLTLVGPWDWGEALHQRFEADSE